MPHIDVTRRHGHGRAQARAAAEAVAASLQSQFGVRTAWEGDTLRLDGKGVTGALVASDDAVRVTADLGLPLRPLRRSLQREIERQLDTFAAG